MYDIIIISAIIFLVMFFYIMYQFAKDLKDDFKMIKHEEMYFKTLEKSLIKWHKGVK